MRSARSKGGCGRRHHHVQGATPGKSCVVKGKRVLGGNVQRHAVKTGAVLERKRGVRLPLTRHQQGGLRHLRTFFVISCHSSYPQRDLLRAERIAHNGDEDLLIAQIKGADPPIGCALIRTLSRRSTNRVKGKVNLRGRRHIG